MNQKNNIFQQKNAFVTKKRNKSVFVFDCCIF